MIAWEDLADLLPLLLPPFTALLIMLACAFRPSHRLASASASAGLFAALGSLALAAPRGLTDLLVVDPLSIFFSALTLGAALVVVALSHHYLSRREVRGERHHREYYLLLLLSVTGAVALAMSRHFAAFFLALELMTVPLFGLIAYPCEERRAVEAGLKYLLLSGISSAVLLLGIAILYAATGSLLYGEVARLAAAADPLLLSGGAALITAGVAFKLSLVPFHLWTPEVYQGAPAPVGAYLSTVAKVALAAGWLRFLQESGAWQWESLPLLFSLLASLSMVTGNLLALWQENLKRLLACSSIAQMGYLFVALAAGGPSMVEGAGYYLAAYLAAMLAAFGAIALLAGPEGGEAEDPREYRGLAWRRPWVAAALAVALLSLAGIPLTVGFIARFYLVMNGLAAALWWVVAALVAASAIGIFFYLRLLVTLFLPVAAARHVRAPWPEGALAALSVFIVFFGLYPMPLIEALRAATGGG